MAEKTKFWYLKNFNILDGVPEEQIKQLEKMASMSQAKKHFPIYFPEQPSMNIFFLKEGHIKLSLLNEDGKEIIIDILGPGEMFGELALVDDEGRKEIAETLDDVMICSISKKDFETLLRQNPELKLRLTK